MQECKEDVMRMQKMFCCAAMYVSAIACNVATGFPFIGNACLLQSETAAHSPDEEMSEFLAILSRHEAHDAALVIAARLGMINEIVSMATEIATNGIPFSEGVRRAVR